MFESRKPSKYYRWLEKNFGTYFRSEKLFEELYRKHFKKHYAGKPTKRYLKIKREIDKADRIPPGRIERLIATGR